jgi:hypothetical protein
MTEEKGRCIVGGINPHHVQTPSEDHFSIKQVNSYVNLWPNSHTLHSFENKSESHTSNTHESVSFIYFYTSQFIVYSQCFNMPPQFVLFCALSNYSISNSTCLLPLTFNQSHAHLPVALRTILESILCNTTLVPTCGLVT